MTTIYLVRHGQVYNPKNILTGRLPGFRLSEKGIKQIRQTAEFLVNRKISEIYASPILRTKQTAGIIQKKLNLTRIIYSDLLLEVKSHFDGIPREKLYKSNFDFYSPQYWQKGDDTMETIAQRMLRFLEIISKKYQGKNVVAATHADPMMILKTVLLKIPLTFSAIREPNKDYVKFGEIFQLDFDSQQNWKIKRIFTTAL